MPLPPRIVLLMGLFRLHVHSLKGALHNIRYGILVLAANLVTGSVLIFIVIVGILFDFISIIFVLVVSGVINSTQAMNFYEKILNKVPALKLFLPRSGNKGK
jgi:hypothetical protein